MEVPLPTPNPGSADAALLAVRQATWQALSRLLQPGAILTARVVEPLGGNSWLFVLRGNTLVAESPEPLQPDSTVRVQVVQDGDQPRLRLLDTTRPNELVRTSDTSTRMQQLGLPATNASRITVATFEAVGAPLERATVQNAVQQVALAPLREQPALAQQFALLAKAGLPASPLGLELAARSLQGSSPDPAVMLRSLATTVANATSAPSTSATGTPAAPLANAPAAAATPLVTSAPGLATLGTTSAATTGTSTGNLSPLATSMALDALRSALPTQVSDLPDPGRDGVAAATRALHHAGLRSHVAGGDVQQPSATKTSEPLALVSAITHLAAQLGNPEGLRPAVIEASANTVLPPHDLAEYDVVLPLAMQDRGVSVPARLAVSSRRTGSGAEATYVRVDAELGGLGPVSARLAGHAGTIAVHLIADGRGHDALIDIRDELTTALQALGLSASVRVSRTAEVQDG